MICAAGRPPHEPTSISFRGHAGRARCRVRRHRHEPSLRASRSDRRRGRHDGRDGNARRPVADLLEPADHHHAEVHRGHPPDGQRWRRRRALAGRARREQAAWQWQGGAAARAARGARHRIFLLRCADHARDLRARRDRGARHHRSGHAAARGPGHARHPGRALCAAATRHRANRAAVRPDHGHLVRLDRLARPPRHHSHARDPDRPQSRVCAECAARPSGPRDDDPRRRVPRVDGRRSALHRHGTFRPQAGADRLVPRGLARAPAQLLWPGCAAAFRAIRHDQSVLRARLAVRPAVPGGAGDCGGNHRLAGDDLRRIFRHAPGRAARPAAPGQDSSDLRRCARPDLRARRQRIHVLRGLRLRAHLPGIERTFRRVWRGRQRHDGHHDAARRHRRAGGLEMANLAHRARVRPLRDRRPRLRSRQRDQDPERRLDTARALGRDVCASSSPGATDGQSCAPNCNGARCPWRNCRRC